MFLPAYHTEKQHNQRKDELAKIYKTYVEMFDSGIPRKGKLNMVILKVNPHTPTSIEKLIANWTALKINADSQPIEGYYVPPLPTPREQDQMTLQALCKELNSITCKQGIHLQVVEIKGTTYFFPQLPALS